MVPMPLHPPLFKQLTLIGVGLIGGSLSAISKKKGLVERVVGYDIVSASLERAVSLGVIDEARERLSHAVEKADLVVLSTPVGNFNSLLKEIAGHLKPGAIVTDVGSIKGDLVAEMEAHLPSTVFFVGGHPIAGREKSGVDAATTNLFYGSRTILTPTRNTQMDALKKVALLWEGAGATVIQMSPYDHDRVFGAVSHLPHLVAYALMDVMLHPNLVTMDPVRFSAGGLRDFTRIAASSSEMWRDIFLFNKKTMLEMIELYQESLDRIKEMIVEEDRDGLLDLLNKAKTVRQKIISETG